MAVDLTNGNGTLSVGVRILDCDHREQAEAIDELQLAVMRGEDRNRTSLLLQRLADFTLSHFALEEGMMAATKYSGLAAHHLHHQRMMECLNAIQLRHKRDGMTMNDQALGYLQELHSTHVQSDDLHYGLWLNQVDKP